MKRIMSFLLSIVMAFFTLPVLNVEASEWPDGPHVDISSNQTSDYIEVNVNLGQYSGLFAFQFDLTYDASLVDITRDDYGDYIITNVITDDGTGKRKPATAIEGEASAHKDEHYVRYLWKSATTSDEYYGTGADNILTIRFNVKEGASGVARFSITNAKFVRKTDSTGDVPSKEGNAGGKSETTQTITGIIDTDIPLTGSYSEIKRAETATYNITSTENVNISFAWGAELADGKFAPATKYTPVITITPKEGYTFGANAAASYDGKTGTLSENTITITLDSVTTNNVTGNIDVATSNYTSPAKGVTAAGTFTTTNNNVTVSELNWGGELDNNGNFKANTTYKPSFTITANNGYDFADATVTVTGDGTSGYTTTTSDNTITVKLPEITTADKEISSIAATVTKTDVAIDTTFDAFVTSNGLTVTATYDDGTSGTLERSQYTSNVGKFDKKGSKTVTITASEKTADVTVNVTAIETTVDFTDPNLTYNGTDQKSAVVSAITTNSDKTPTTDLTEVKNAGTYNFHISVSGSERYSDVSNLEKSFTVAKKDIASTDFGDIESKTYNGTQLQPTVTLVTTDIGDKLTYTYGENKNAGTGTVTITATDQNQNYKGSVTKEFTIDPVVLTVNNISLAGTTTTKEYNGNNHVTTLVAAIKDSVAALNGTTLEGSAAYESSDVGNNIKIIFTPSAVTSGNYRISSETKAETTGSITAVTSEHITDNNHSTAESRISVPKATGNFPEVTFGGVNEETATGTVAYSYDGATTIEDIRDKLKALNADATAEISYTFTGTGNYAGATKPGTLYVKVVNIEFKIEGQPVTNDNAVTKKSDPTYGDTWENLVTVNSNIKAGMQTDSGYVEGTGTFTVSGDETLGAGEHNYTVFFNGTVNGIDFTNTPVAAGSITIAKKVLTAENLEDKSVTKLYDGTADCDLTSLNVISGLENDDQNVTVTGTTSYSGTDIGTTSAVFTPLSTAEPVSNTNYTISSESIKTLNASITKRPVTVTASAQTITYGASISTDLTNATLGETITGASLSAVTLSTDKTDVGTYENAIVPSNAAILLNSVDVTSNFEITYNNGTLTINKAANSVTAPTINGWTYGDTPSSPSDSTATFGTVKYRYQKPDGGTQDVMSATDKAGTWKVQAYVDATSNYDGATSNWTEFTIVPKALTADNLANTRVTKTYDGTTSSTFNSLDVISGLVGEDTGVTVSGNTVFGGAGVSTTEATFTASSVNNENYTVTGTLTKSLPATITKKEVTITAGAQTITYGDTIATSDVTKATLADALEGHTISGITLSTDKTHVGTYTDGITASNATITGGGADVTENYQITYNKGSLTITKAANSVTNPTIANWTYGDSPASPTGSSATFGTVKYRYKNSNDHTQDAMHATDAAGTWYVQAYVTGNDDYNGTESEWVEFTISKAELSVSYATTTITNVDDLPDDLKVEGLKNGDQFADITSSTVSITKPNIPTVVNSHGETVKQTGKYNVGLSAEGWTSTNYSINLAAENAVTVTYKIIAGADQSWRKGTATGAVITSNSDFTDKFSKVLVGGTEVAATNYTAADGSIVVTFTPAYLETLSLGKHTVEIVSTDGSATTTLTILPKEEKPSDGGSSSSKKETASGTSVVTCQDAGFPANYAWNEAAKACQPGYIDANGTFHSTQTNSRRGVANTNDTGLGSWVVMFTSSIVMGVISAYVMRKYK